MPKNTTTVTMTMDLLPLGEVVRQRPYAQDEVAIEELHREIGTGDNGSITKVALYRMAVHAGLPIIKKQLQHLTRNEDAT